MLAFKLLHGALEANTDAVNLLFYVDEAVRALEVVLMMLDFDFTVIVVIRVASWWRRTRLCLLTLPSFGLSSVRSGPAFGFLRLDFFLFSHLFFSFSHLFLHELFFPCFFLILSSSTRSLSSSLLFEIFFLLVDFCLFLLPCTCWLRFLLQDTKSDKINDIPYEVS